MPIKARIDMLATGICTPVGIKVLGQDLKVIEKLARDIEMATKPCPASSAFAERGLAATTSRSADRTQLALWTDGADLQQVVASGLGAETVTTTVKAGALRRQPPLSARSPQRPSGDRT
jgi:Cu(I)/Ag(I) efflux system membrane protein CusA/SilA